MKKVKWIIIGCVFAVIIGTAAYMSTLRIEKVTYEGNDRVTDEVLDSYIFKSKYSKNPLMFYYKTKYTTQPEIPFVDRYDVEMNSLSSVVITVYEKDMIGCVRYMGAYLYFDKDGMVVESSDKSQSDIPLITGLNFDYFVLDSKLPVKDESIFNEILGITQQLNKYKINVNKINISQNMEISLHIKKVVVDLGVDDDTMNDKIVDLSDMMPNLKGLSGTLNMTEYNSNRTGYTFKKNK